MRKTKVLTALAIILLIIVSVASIVFVLYWNKLDLLQYDDGTRDQPGTKSIRIQEASDKKADEVVDPETGLTANEKENLDIVPDSKAKELANVTQDVVPPTVKPIENDEVINILLIGTDEATSYFSRNANSDAMIIASINKGAGTLKLVSLERGTAVPLTVGQYYGQYEWLNAMLRTGGPTFLQETVEECFRVELEGYIRINLQTFIQMVNLCNGIDINLTDLESAYLNNEIPEGKYAVGHAKQLGISDKVQKVKSGVNHLNGETAVLYTRCRYIDSDWNRLQRHRNVIQSAVTSAKALSLDELNTMINNVLPLVQTNLSKAQITELLFAVPGVIGKEAKQMSLPKEGTYSIMQGLHGKNMFSTDFDKNAKILQDFLYK